MSSKIQTGKTGEDIAANFLIAQGYTILTRNYRSKYGEIDIIAGRDELVFIEVKTRRTETFGEPQEAVTRSKRIKILKTALHFLNTSSQKLPAIWRCDVIAVKLTLQNKFKDLNHFKNIFDG